MRIGSAANFNIAHAKDMLTRQLPGCTVHYRVLCRMGITLQDVEALVSTDTFVASRIFEDWIVFADLLDERLTLLEDFNVENSFSLQVCDNLELAFLRAVLHWDYLIQKSDILTLQIEFMVQNPSQEFFTFFDYSVLLVSLLWSDDSILIPKLLEFLELSENEAHWHGLLNGFLYMNYALWTQDVMGSIDEGNLSRMREIQGRYNPNAVFKRYWKGGYKL
ncbi:hypothetical protein B0H10DRAFT_2218801 [Mycena sp. CBHHK59/15]|nr:hypothetical protein B0H10DRAFT_2218801 [Mycena sp. CBHHK59/15]